MKNYKLKARPGDDFNSVAKKAIEIAKEKNVIVEFDFNEITCLVGDRTVEEWLSRDYHNAFVMEWKTVGPDCKMMYDNDMEIELRTRQLAQAKRWKEEAAEQKAKDDAEKMLVLHKIGDTQLEIIPEKIEEYQKYVENNSKNGYSRAVIDYSEAWAKLMQIEISKGRGVSECANETQKGLGYLGITGFQYGCAVKGLAHFWKYGEELRKWHNKEYGVSEDKAGVVNPAVFTINA